MAIVGQHPLDQAIVSRPDVTRLREYATGELAASAAGPTYLEAR
jgi:hypothetical protein